MGSIEKNFSRSFRFGANPSIIYGMASVFDLGGTLNLFNLSETGAEADLKALRNDWGVAAFDLCDAVSKWETDNGVKIKQGA